MNAFNSLLVCLLMLVCVSLVSSRHQRRVDFSNISKAQAEERRLDQDYQNLITKQQQLEKVERIQSIARKQMGMERPASDRLEHVSAKELAR